MCDDQRYDVEDIRQFAQQLSFCDDDDVLEACLSKVADLEEDIELSLPESGENHGQPSDDEYNALLSVYESPRRETSDGPLDGMTLAIKDNIAVEGLPMTAGLADHSYVPSYDAILVERLLNAGASIHGKANMDALAIGPEGVWSERGQVRNPIADDRVPGGSSSGSAVAVATGIVDAAIGTDAGGSIRKPAAYNELVGVKPTSGLVPSDGKVLTQTTLGAIGPIARDVADAAAILDVIAGPDKRNPDAAAVELGQCVENLDETLVCTVGVPDSFLDCAALPVRNVIEVIINDIVDRTDCRVREVSVDNGVANLPSYLSGPELRWLFEQGAVNHGPSIASDPAWYALFEGLREEGLNEHVTLRKLPGAFLEEETDGLSYIAAHRQMVEFQETLDSIFDDVDLLLTPTVPELPPALEDDIENLSRNLSINCQPFNLAGTPSVAIPAGRSEGLPVSAQITAPIYEDSLALRGARLVERLQE